MMLKLLDQYAEYNAFLSEADAVMSIAECHGMFCGLLSLQLDAQLSQCLRYVFSGESSSVEIDKDDEDKLKVDCIKNLQKVFDQTRIDLNDVNIEFNLLIADDDDALSLRISDLQFWTQGYLFGLGIAGLDIERSINKNLSEANGQDESTANKVSEISEMIRDIVQISHISVEGLGDSEDSEKDFYELSEYVRIGVLYIQEECNPLIQSTKIH